MSNYYSAPYSQQNQQQGQPSSSYYGQTTNNTNAGDSYGQSTSEKMERNGGQDSSWQQSSFVASSSTTNPQQYQYQHQPQKPSSQPQQQNSTLQQQAGGNPSFNHFFNPAALSSAAGVASAVMGGTQNEAMLMEAGKNIFEVGIAKMIPGLERGMICLRVYFAVNNGYVKRKMGMVLFSFFNKEWRRMILDKPTDLGGNKFALPHTDDNALDLYLPSMSLITYVLLCALCYGAVGQFNPEVLPDIITGCVLTQIFEVVLFRFGFYMMQAPIALLDLLAITGYKYLGLAMNMLVGVVLEVFMDTGSRRGYFVAFLWTASAVSYFVLKTMSGFVPEITSSKGPKREFMIAGFGASQFVTMWFLGQTKFLK